MESRALERELVSRFYRGNGLNLGIAAVAALAGGPGDGVREGAGRALPPLQSGVELDRLDAARNERLCGLRH